MPIKCHNRVLLLLACVAIVAVALPFVNVAPNRLVSGEPRALWQIWAFTPLLLGAALASTVALAFWPGRTALWLTFLLSEALFIVLFWSAGQAATQMAAVESPLARTSVGSGLWLWLALCLLVCSDAIRRLTPQPVWRWLLNAQFWVIPLLILFSGDLNQLSLLKEYVNRQEVFDNALAQHLTILFGTLIPALLLGVPLGMWCYRHTSRQGAVFTVLNVIQTIPSVAPVWPADCPPRRSGEILPCVGRGRHCRNRADASADCPCAVCAAAAGARRGGGVKPGSARRAGKRPCDGDERAPVFLENTAAACASAAGSQPAGGDSANRGDGGDCRADRGGRLWGTGLPGAAQ